MPPGSQIFIIILLAIRTWGVARQAAGINNDRPLDIEQFASDFTKASLTRFYQDVIRFSCRHPAMHSPEIDIIHALGNNRVIAFTRSAGTGQLPVIASLRNEPFLDGYVIQTDPSRLPDGSWREVSNSDASLFGGHDIGIFGGDVPATGGRIQIRIPQNDFWFFKRFEIFGLQKNANGTGMRLFLQKKIG
jgi:hypothetical protein